MSPCADAAAVSEEPSVDEVRAIVEARFPDVRVERCELLPGGWDHSLLLVNGEWIFRVPLRPESEATLEKEVRLLAALGPALPVPVPRYERVGRGDRAPRVIAAYRRIGGVPVTRASLEGTAGARLCEQLATFLTDLHAFPLHRADAVGIPVRDPLAWRREYEDFLQWIEREAFPSLAPREREWASRVCEDFLGDPSHFRFHPVLLHRDLSTEHILHDPSTGRITGVLDWGDASTGDPAFDFTGLLADLGEPSARSVLGLYRGPKDRGMMDRARFYANVIPFYGIIYGRKLGHPEWTREGRKRLRGLVG